LKEFPIIRNLIFVYWMVSSAARLITISNMDQSDDKNYVCDNQTISGKKFGTIFDSSPVDMAIVDLDGTILDVNLAAVKMHGFAAKENLIGKNYSIFVDDADKNKARESWDQALANGGITDLNLTLLSEEGKKIKASLSASVLRDGNNKPCALLTIIRNTADYAETELKYSTILATSLNGFWLIDAEGRFLEVNDAYCRMTGYTQEELRAMRMSDVEASEKPEEVLRHIEAIKNKTYEHFTTRHRRKDGSIFDIEINTNFLNIGPGQIVGFGQDVTESRRIEAELKRSEERATALIRYAPVAIYEIDFFGKRFLSVNDAMCKITGYSREELLAMSPLELTDEKGNNEFRERIRMKLAGDEDKPAELRVKTKDGRWLDVVLNASSFNYKEGKPESVLVVAYDITRRKKDEEEKNNFIAIMAHELRNPLAPILARAELLRLTKEIEGPQRRKIDPVLQNSIEVIERQAKNMARLLDDLLDISRIIRGKVQLKKHPMELAPVVQHAIESAKTAINSQKHELNVSLPEKPVWLDADNVRIEQIISNLLFNAAKYTESGGKISLSVLRKENEVLISVKDNGIGIEPRLQGEIFKIFSRSENSLTENQGGLGIGLKVTRDLVEMHGGSITVESEGAGKGSEFTVTLPALPESWQPESASPAVMDNAKNSASPGKRILVVDDNVDAASSLSKLMAFFGHETRTEHEGLSAIKTVFEWRPDAIILDIGLPGIDGLETAKRIRADAGDYKPVMIAVTGYGQEEDRAKSKQAGFDYHLVKPVDTQELKRILS
jgi:PAS domain S-box-containing protein